MTSTTLARRPKVVLATVGTYGDLHPFIGVALELRAAGYEQVIASSEHYRGKVEAEGIAFHAVRPDEHERQRDLGMDEAALTRELMRGGIGSLEFVMRSLILPYLRQSHQDMMEATKGCALVVTSSFAFGATLAAQKRVLRYINIALQPCMIQSLDDPPPMISFPWLRKLSPRIARKVTAALFAAMNRKVASWAQPIHELRGEIGLPALKTNPLLEGQASPFGTLGLYSPLLGTSQPDDTRTSIAGFTFYDSENGGGQQLEPALERFLCTGPAPLVFTLGSQAVHNAGHFYQESLTAARQLGRRAVILVGRHEQGQLPAGLPTDILACLCTLLASFSARRGNHSPWRNWHHGSSAPLGPAAARRPVLGRPTRQCRASCTPWCCSVARPQTLPGYPSTQGTRSLTRSTELCRPCGASK